MYSYLYISYEQRMKTYKKYKRVDVVEQVRLLEGGRLQSVDVAGVDKKKEVAKTIHTTEMEKFSTWRDRGTGISPFMPVEAPPASPVARLGVQPLVFGVKLPFLLVALALYWTVLPLPAMARFILGTLCGFCIEVSVDGVKRSRVDEIDRARPSTNDWVVANYVSPLNGLILASVARCSWRDIVVLIPNQHGQLLQYSVWGVIAHALSSDPVPAPHLKEVSSLFGKLVLHFPEGTPSNNRALLPLIGIPPVDGFTVKTVLLKVSPPTLTTPLPLASPWQYFYSLVSTSARRSVKAKIFPHVDSNVNLAESQKYFDLNQLSSVGTELDLQLKQRFYTEYLRVRK